MDLPIPKARKVVPSGVAMDDDPFERLPEHILHHILSMLPSRKAAARTALISRSWRRAWSSYPLSDFDLADFCAADAYRAPIHTLREANEKFLGFIDRAMSRLREHGTSLPKLKIRTTLVEMEPSSSLLDRWICMALDDRAQDLDLMVDIRNPDCSYRVPARVFSSGFYIRTLALHGSRLSAAPLNSIITVNLNSLRTLILGLVPISDQMLQKLLRGCPLLENLRLGWCGLLRNVIIPGLDKIRMIDLGGKFDRVEIEAPSLEKFIYFDAEEGEDVIIGLDGCRKLKELSLWHSAISQEQFQGLLPKLPLLESLIIGHCRRVEKIRILNPLIRTIGVFVHGISLDIEIDAPKLSYFNFHSDVIPLITMRNPTPLSSNKVDFGPVVPVGDEWFVRLGEFVSRSCWLKSLSVHMGYMVGPHVAPGDILLPSLPSEVDELRLMGAPPPSGHGLILDGMLSACHPKSLCVERCRNDDAFLRFLCEKLATREDDTNCPCSSQRKCWLHELKRWEIERIGPTNYVGSSDWTSLSDRLLPTLGNYVDVYFRLHW